MSINSAKIAKSLLSLAKEMESEAGALTKLGRTLTSNEIDYVNKCQSGAQTLRRMSADFEVQRDNLITYELTGTIPEDLRTSLRTATRSACRFWNRFCGPKYNILIKAGVFEAADKRTIARAWPPRFLGETMVGRIEYNTAYLKTTSEPEAASIMAHEIGHTLGFGFGNWFDIFNWKTCKVFPEVLDSLDDNDPLKNQIAKMVIEAEGGSGTAYSHWDENE